MIPYRRFQIHQPADLAEASRMLTDLGDEGGVYAGGTELLLAMRHGALSYKHLVDVKVIPGLNGIEQRKDCVEIGAAVTHRDIERSGLVKAKVPVLAEMESRVANVRVRATGTLAGNLCFAEPHSDPATLLLVLGGKVTIARAGSSREVGIEELITGAYANGLEPGEIVATVRVPCVTEKHRAAYVKFQVHERPTLGLGLWLETPDAGRSFRAGRVAVGCVCPFPSRSPEAESLFAGSRAEVEDRLPQIAGVLASGADLIADHEGSVEYKKHLIGVFLRRAFAKAVSQN